MKIPWARPFINEDVVNEVLETTRSGWLSMGKRVNLLENTLAQYIGRKNAIAVANGSIALDISLDLLDIGSSGEIIVPAISYVATATAAIRTGAKIIFADIDPFTYNLDPDDLARKVSSRTKCIILIDYGGNPANHKAILDIAEAMNISILHDGAHSLAGRYDGKALCTQGIISTTSLHAAKLLTTIEGGVIFTDLDVLANQAKALRNQGEESGAKFLHSSLGYNARLTDLQAAIALAQFKCWDDIVRKRLEIANFYCSSLIDKPGIVLPKTECSCSASIVGEECCRNGWFLFPILINDRDRVAIELGEAGIETRICFPKPLYKQPFYEKYKRPGDGSDSCPVAEWFSNHVLNLPMFHEITCDELNYIVDIIDALTKRINSEAYYHKG